MMIDAAVASGVDEARRISREEFQTLHGGDANVAHKHALFVVNRVAVCLRVACANGALESTLVYRKSRTDSANAAMRVALRSGSAIRVVGHSASSAAYYDKGLYTVKTEDKGSFLLHRTTPPAAVVDVNAASGVRSFVEPSTIAGAAPEAAFNAVPAFTAVPAFNAVQVPPQRKFSGECVTIDLNMPPTQQLQQHVTVASQEPPPHKRQKQEPQQQQQQQQHPVAMPTLIDGASCRSRLEARFIIFLKTLKVAYEYETVTFTLLSGRKYTPDFYLPTLRLWVELKPAFPHAEEMERCVELCKRGFPTVLVYGDRFVPPFAAEGGGGKRTYDHANALRGMAWDAQGRRLAGDVAWIIMPGLPDLAPRLCAVTEPVEMEAACHPRLVHAFDAAASYQFV